MQPSPTLHVTLLLMNLSRFTYTFVRRNTKRSIARTAYICLLLWILMVFIAHSAHAKVPAISQRIRPINLTQAQKWCDTTALHSLEGIYYFPSNECVVLIKANDRHPLLPPSCYHIINIESQNILIAPGQIIGYLFPTGDPAQFRLTLYSHITDGGLKKPRDYAARFSPQQAALTYDKSKTRIKFNPLALIPKLNRFIRISHDDPTNNIREGFIRIYPINTSSPLSAPMLPRYF